MLAIVKTLIVWAEMVGGCIGDAPASLKLNSETSVNGALVVTAAVIVETPSNDLVTCISDGLTEIGW